MLFLVLITKQVPDIGTSFIDTVVTTAVEIDDNNFIIDHRMYDIWCINSESVFHYLLLLCLKIDVFVFPAQLATGSLRGDGAKHSMSHRPS